MFISGKKLGRGGGWGDALFFRHDAFLTILGHYRYMYSLTGQILKQLFPSVLVPSDCHLGFFKNFIFNKNAANFLEISRKHVFISEDIIQLMSKDVFIIGLQVLKVSF